MFKKLCRDSLALIRFTKACSSRSFSKESHSTLSNYIRKIAQISLHFGCLPEKISDEQINEYLTSLAIDSRSPSRSGFKHMVYGLRYYFHHVGKTDLAIKLPSLKKEATLPVILNRSELKALLKAPRLLKHRVILTLIYSAGLRRQEAINLKIPDIDFERKSIHFRKSKYLKDRIVPLSDYMSCGLKKYLEAEKPHDYLFNGKEADGRYSINGLSWLMREALKGSGIKKKVNLHSLRHSYATHLLEEGVNIVTVKELLGHADVTTTMIYLRVARLDVIKAHSPLDTLYKEAL